MKKEILIKNETNNPSHAYIITGCQKDREEFVKNFILELDIKPADLYFLNPIDKLKIQEIRLLQHQINLTPHSSKYKIAVIDNSSMLTMEAMSALLKTLEEPPKNSIIILCADSEDVFLPTVLSRSRKIKITKHAQNELSLDELELLKSLKTLTVKEKFDLASKLQAASDLQNFLEKWLIYLRSELLSGREQGDLVKKIYQLKKMLKTNINPKLLAENLFLEI